MLFQSLGGHYTAPRAWANLMAISFRGRQLLREHLKDRYQADGVELYENGRTALAEGLKLVCKPGDKVIVNGLTCYSVIQAVGAAGCRPVYVDIDAKTLNFDTKELDRILRKDKSIKALVVQNTLGIMADIEAIKKLADEHKVELIEDLAHSAGLIYSSGTEAGFVADVVMLSFGRDKSVDAGGGGALVVRGKRITKKTSAASALNSLRNRVYPVLSMAARYSFGWVVGKIILKLGYALRLMVRSADGSATSMRTIPNWQAKVVLRELDNLENTWAIRNNNSSAYLEKLDTQLVPYGTRTSNGLVRFPVVVEDPKKIINTMQKQGLYLNDTWYDVPVIPARLYERSGYDEESCPTATEISRKMINLPTHLNVTSDDIKKITRVLRGVNK